MSFFSVTKYVLGIFSRYFAVNTEFNVMMVDSFNFSNLEMLSHVKNAN